MKLKSYLLAGALIAVGLSPSTWAQKNGKDPSPTPLGAEKRFDEFHNIQIKNYQGESLGRIKDLGIDLVNGRIVEVLVMTNSALEGPQKVVGVPPHALAPDLLNQVYRLNVTTEMFDAAPKIVLKDWGDGANRSERIAAAYRYFGQEPYFLEEGAPATPTTERAKAPLGYVERSTKMVDLPVGNFQKEKFGKVWSMTLDITNGRILNVIVIAPGNFKTKSVINPLALSFNEKRNALLLDDSKMEYSDEPRFVFTEAVYGQDDHSRQEANNLPVAAGVPVQGNSYRDVDRTVRIHKDIRAAKINARNVQIGTLNGQVTLRGWVHTEEDKRRIDEIATTETLPEIVHSQIVVGKPLTRN